MTFICHVTHQPCDCIGRCRVLDDSRADAIAGGSDRILVVGNPSPDDLRAEADRIESAECTGIAASWCPLHGRCSCPVAEDGSRESLDDPNCPLHGPDSSHAEDALRALNP